MEEVLSIKTGSFTLFRVTSAKISTTQNKNKQFKIRKLVTDKMLKFFVIK